MRDATIWNPVFLETLWLAGNSLVSIKILDIDKPCPRLLHGPQVGCKLNLHVKREIDQNWVQTLVDFKIFNDTMIFINARQVAYQMVLVTPKLKNLMVQANRSNGKFSL